MFSVFESEAEIKQSEATNMSGSAKGASLSSDVRNSNGDFSLSVLGDENDHHMLLPNELTRSRRFSTSGTWGGSAASTRSSLGRGARSAALDVTISVSGSRLSSASRGVVPSSRQHLHHQRRRTTYAVASADKLVNSSIDT